MPNTNKKIKINTVLGGKDKSQIDGCYFQQDVAPATTYSFYDQNGGTTLATGITSGTAFSFSFAASPSITWSVTPTIVGDTASGPWSNDDKTIDADEDGTWTAQATPEEGVSAEDDDSAASAYA